MFVLRKNWPKNMGMVVVVSYRREVQKWLKEAGYKWIVLHARPRGKLYILDYDPENIWWIPRFERVTMASWRAGWLNFAFSVTDMITLMHDPESHSYPDNLILVDVPLQKGDDALDVLVEMDTIIQHYDYRAFWYPLAENIPQYIPKERPQAELHKEDAHRVHTMRITGERIYIPVFRTSGERVNLMLLDFLVRSRPLMTVDRQRGIMRPFDVVMDNEGAPVTGLTISTIKKKDGEKKI